MPEDRQQSVAVRMFGDFAPALVGFTDDVLFGQVWEREELSPRDRSLVTVASLLTSGSTEQLVFHLGLAKQNGLTEQELIEAITHWRSTRDGRRPCPRWRWRSRCSARSSQFGAADAYRAIDERPAMKALLQPGTGLINKGDLR